MSLLTQRAEAPEEKVTVTTPEDAIANTVCATCMESVATTDVVTIGRGTRKCHACHNLFARLKRVLNANERLEDGTATTKHQLKKRKKNARAINKNARRLGDDDERADAAILPAAQDNQRRRTGESSSNKLPPNARNATRNLQVPWRRIQDVF